VRFETGKNHYSVSELQFSRNSRTGRVTSKSWHVGNVATKCILWCHFTHVWRYRDVLQGKTLFWYLQLTARNFFKGFCSKTYAR